MISFCKKWLRFILFCLGMRILVVAAMPHELKAIKNWIKSAWIKENLDIDYLCCW
jgi:phage terminase large subunit